MNEHHDERRPDTPAADAPQRGGRPASLGDRLVEARSRKGLELSDIAELTHVRLEYLRALEEGRYGDLPEDVYTRNYVRLYAHAVGLESGPALEVYAHERRRANGMSTLEQKLEQERRGEVPERDRRSGPPFGSLLPTLLLVVVLVGLAVWGFNSLLFRPARSPAPVEATSGGGAKAATANGPGAGPASASPNAAPTGGAATAQPPAGVVGDAVQARTVLVSVQTTPPGASVSIDGFALPGTTPIHNAPVTAREGRLLEVTLQGYEPVQETVDLRQNRSFSFTLKPSPSAPATAGNSEPKGMITPGSIGPNQIGLNITARTWLEVYQSTARNQGKRLVYATVDPGKHYVFDLPVYLHVGNAAGVDIVLHGKDLGQMGSPGAVVSRAFPAP